MGDVEGWEDAPTPVYLGVVLVDFCDHQEDCPEQDGNAEARNEWIGMQIEVDYILPRLQDIHELGRELVELRDVRLDRL